jgi:hypothetical protein
LNKFSVNYHGELNLSPERVGVYNDHKMCLYKSDMCTNLDLAIRTLPDLAMELAVDILTDDHSDTFAGILIPRTKKERPNIGSHSNQPCVSGSESRLR